MNYRAMTNAGIAAELGSRIEQLRLSRNMTQMELSEEIGITPKSYRQLIAGSGKLENVIAALRALNCLEQLDNFLPKPPPSPLEQLKLQGKQRQRARTRHHSIPEKIPTEGIKEPNAKSLGLDW
jgi:transcriptional regulator with XRE-family HTH domain